LRPARHDAHRRGGIRWATRRYQITPAASPGRPINVGGVWLADRRDSQRAVAKLGGTRHPWPILDRWARECARRQGPV